MYAVIKAGGHQYKVSAGDRILIDRQGGAEGDSVTFKDILALGGGSKLAVGAPLVQGASVEATITKQAFAPKVTIFKFKRRKNYKLKRGHKQPLTEVEIKSINHA